VKSLGHGVVFTLCLVQHPSAALTALTPIAGFSGDANAEAGVVFTWQEIGGFRQVMPCSKTPASETEGVFSHHTGVNG